MLLNNKRLTELSKLVRFHVLKSTTAAGSGHPSSCLSATDLMTVLLYGGFFHAHVEKPNHPSNDRLIFSKGHAAPLFYSLYAVAHQFDEQELLKLRKFESPLEGHPTMNFPFTEVATGSLGQGLSVGIGFALNAKYVEGLSCKTFVLLGDSEVAEGSVWEAAQIAAHYELNNLIGILDVNGLGQRGPTMYGHEISEYEKKFKAFGWKTIQIDGHNFSQIASAYKTALKEKEKPVMIIARTEKGKGIKLIEGKEGWHGKALSEEECEEAVKDLGKINKSVRGVIFKPIDEKPSEWNGKFQLTRVHYPIGEKFSPRESYGTALVSLFPHYRNMVVLDAEVSNSTGAETFKKIYPDRFFEMFIAEQNMVGTALGFSRRGKIPFISTFAAFFSRAADQIRMSQYSNSNIKFVGTHPGVSIGEDGSSQMGLEDIAIFRSQIGGVVLYPADAVATQKLVAEAAKHVGNVYLRMTREKLSTIYRENEQFFIGGSKTLRQSENDDVTIISAGITLHEALKAYDVLLEEGITARVLDLYSIKPIDLEGLGKAARETKVIITVEDHYEAGGIGEAVRSAIDELDLEELNRPQVISLAVKNIPHSGKTGELLAFEEIDSAAIVKKAKELFGKKIGFASVAL